MVAFEYVGRQEGATPHLRVRLYRRCRSPPLILTLFLEGKRFVQNIPTYFFLQMNHSQSGRVKDAKTAPKWGMTIFKVSHRWCSSFFVDNRNGATDTAAPKLAIANRRSTDG